MATTGFDTRQHVDASGSPLFGAGELGAWHVFIHRCLDAGELGRGAQALRRFLRGRPARDSAGVHLHWHLLVLDIALGRPDLGYARFSQQVLPWIPRGYARTDGPSALWHLALASGEPSRLPWQPAARLARARLHEPDPFLALHDALALAGACAVDALDAWLERWSAHGGALVRFGQGLRAHAAGDRAEAARLFARARLRQLGGSLAQHALFELFASKYEQLRLTAA